MSTRTSPKPSIIPTDLRVKADTRQEGVAVAKSLSRQHPNVPFALMTHFGRSDCYVEVYRELDHSTLRYYKPDEAAPNGVFVNGKEAVMVDGELADPPKVVQHRMMICVDYLVPEGCEVESYEAGIAVIAKALRDRSIEYPAVWLDPEEDGVELPEEFKQIEIYPKG